MRLPRIMIAAPASGSGKTLITCGLLWAFAGRGKKPVSFKCGPDYIDPMFHRKVLGVPARNLDTFFTDAGMVRYLLGKAAVKADISVLEGVMGFYDGAGGITDVASSYDVARATDTPVILVIHAKGMSLSVLPLIQGFLTYRKDSRIAGVILNQVTESAYRMLKGKIEQELPIKVFGYVPFCTGLVLKSRHLGLVTPDEVKGLQDKLQAFSKVLEQTLDIEGILACAKGAAPISVEDPHWWKELRQPYKNQKAPVKLGIAKDEAFCFCYEENLELLQELGAQLSFFSPLHDKSLPSGLDGMILYGGYPELYARELSGNHKIKQQIHTCLTGGMPYLAECGGFLYLQESLEDMEGNRYPMAGVYPGKAYRTQKLGRFGYLTLTPRENGQLLPYGEHIKAHEFHYYDCTENGGSYHGAKPFSAREWDCIHGGRQYAAGFPHLYYYSNPAFAFHFVQQCRAYRRKLEKGRLWT